MCCFPILASTVTLLHTKMQMHRHCVAEYHAKDLMVLVMLVNKLHSYAHIEVI